MGVHDGPEYAASLESQVPYTMPSSVKVSEALFQATQQLQLGSDKEKIPASFDWNTLAEHGFEDLDPNGHFTGKNPRLGKR